MNNQIRVRVFFPNYTSTGVRNAICDTFSVKDFKYKHIQFVDDDTYTHVIIINYYNNKIIPKIKKTISKKNVLAIAWEPPIFLPKGKDFKDYADKNIGKFLYGQVLRNYPKCFVGHYGFISHIPFQPKPEKTKFMSIVLSKKKQLDGHKHRHSLVQAILKTDLDIHIYGRGANQYSSDRVKGEFERMEPYKDYTFTIAIENKRYK